MAVVADDTEPTPPCGGCRQVLHEFGPEMHVVAEADNGRRADGSFGSLLPAAFDSASLRDAVTFRSGLVAVLGRPNVGKSTLVNALVGQKVAIVSNKPQTTRRDIRAILTTDDHQVVFTDTPGFHKPRTLLGSRLNELVGEATAGVDVVVMVVDARAGVGRGDAFVFERQVKRAGVPAICAVNKIDLLRARAEVPQLQAAADLGAFEEIVPVSARTGRGLDVLLEVLLARTARGPAAVPRGAGDGPAARDAPG